MVITNEIEWDETITTIMDDTGQLQDVQIFIDEGGVYIRQWNEPTQGHELIIMSTDMFNEFLTALDLGEGMFKVK